MRFTFAFVASCATPELSEPPAPPPPEPPAVVFVVRHAEKTSAASDATLTEEGQARAALLAQMLSDVDLVAIHSTDTVRTRATAQPTAEAHSLPVSLYAQHEPLVEEILELRGSHLVVGHSDTVPSLLRLLDPSAEIAYFSGNEYDRLYLVVLTDTGTSTTLLRYGEPAE